MNKLPSLLAAIASLLAVPAFAACVSPPATAGATAYASNIATMVYCDGTHWVSMAGGVSATIGGTTYNNTPGGSASQVQYNNGSGGFAGDSGLTYSSGLLTATNISTTNLTASGNITAAAFYGDGSHLTGISTSTALGDRIVSGSTSAIAQGSSGVVSVNGTLTMNNTGSETCDAAHAYTLRVNPTTNTVQMCRP
jgi:hypothetical protein